MLQSMNDGMRPDIAAAWANVSLRTAIQTSLIASLWSAVISVIVGTALGYALVRHPMYLSYVLADIGYNLKEWNVGTVLLVLMGWAALVFRIHAEERILSRDSGWVKYKTLVRYRLLPGLW